MKSKLKALGILAVLICGALLMALFRLGPSPCVVTHFWTEMSWRSCSKLLTSDKFYLGNLGVSLVGLIGLNPMPACYQ